MPQRRSTPAAAPSEDAIRVAAYHLWEAEGRPEGRAQEHWASAVRQVVDAGITAPARPRARTKVKAS